MGRDTSVFDERRSYAPEPRGRDFCQSPPYAILPLLPYLDPKWIIWEPAAGEGILAQSLRAKGYSVVETCILRGQDFFLPIFEPPDYNCIVTNIPWSNVAPWFRHAFELGKPFCFLAPSYIHANTEIQRLNEEFGDFEQVYPESRINYKMPQKGWSAKGAHVNSHWYTFGSEIGKPFVRLCPINKEKKKFHEEMNNAKSD